MPRIRRATALVVPVLAGLLVTGLVPARAAAGAPAPEPASGTVFPVPEVRGPVPSRVGSAGHDYTFFASDLGLPARGYVEQEYLYSGRANVYDATVAPGIGARP